MDNKSRNIQLDRSGVSTREDGRKTAATSYFPRMANSRSTAWQGDSPWNFEGDEVVVGSDGDRDDARERNLRVDPEMGEEGTRYSSRLGFELGETRSSISGVQYSSLGSERSDLDVYGIPHVPPTPPGTDLLPSPPLPDILTLPLQIRHSTNARFPSSSPDPNLAIEFDQLASTRNPIIKNTQKVPRPPMEIPVRPPSLPPPRLSLPPRARSRERVNDQQHASSSSSSGYLPPTPQSLSTHVPSLPPQLPALHRLSGFSHFQFRPTSTGSYSVPSAAARDLLRHPLMHENEDAPELDISNVETLVEESRAGIDSDQEPVDVSPPLISPFSHSESGPPSPHRSEFSSTAHHPPPGVFVSRESFIEGDQRATRMTRKDRDQGSPANRYEYIQSVEPTSPNFPLPPSPISPDSPHYPPSPYSPHFPHSPHSLHSAHSPHFPRFSPNGQQSFRTGRRPILLSIAGSSQRAFAPTPPPREAPSIPLPRPPSFTALFVDPDTNSVPAPSVSKLGNYVKYQTADSASMEQYRIASWLGREESGSLSLRDQDSMGGTGTSRRAEKLGKSKSPLRDQHRLSGKSSMWSYSVFSSARQRERWSSLDENSKEHSKRAKREEKERERELKRVLRGRRTTQNWLSGVTPAEPPPEAPDALEIPQSKGIFGKAHRRTLSGHLTPSARRLRIFLAVALLLLLAILATVLGIELSHHSSAPSTIGSCVCQNGGAASVASNGTCSCTCVGSFGGMYCQSSTTCVAPQGASYRIAQGLIDISTQANIVLSPSIDLARLGYVLDTYLHLPAAPINCVSQLQIVALPNLPPSAYPRRAQFATASILWATAMSEANSTTLRNFVASLDFTRLGDLVTTPNSNFQSTS